MNWWQIARLAIHLYFLARRLGPEVKTLLGLYRDIVVMVAEIRRAGHPAEADNFGNQAAAALDAVKRGEQIYAPLVMLKGQVKSAHARCVGGQCQI